jgi:hypothetical protein
MTRRIFSGSFLALTLGTCALVAPAIAMPPAPSTNGTASKAPSLDAVLDQWRAAHGSTWRLQTDAETGYLEILYGGHVAASVTPRNDSEFEGLARGALLDTAAMHGVDADTLVHERTEFLPLGQIGSTDKETVRFREEVNGVRVVGGYVNVLFSAAAAPLFALGSPAAAGGYGSDTILKILEIVVILDVIAVGLGAAVASTRGVFALARDRRIPGVLAKVSATRGTPVGSIVFVSLWSLAMVILTKARPDTFSVPGFPPYFAVFAWLSSFGAFALVVVYAAMSIGAFQGLADHANVTGVTIAAIVGLAISAGAIFGAIYKVPSPTKLVVYYALVWLVVGVVVTIAVQGREPASHALADLRSDGEAG